MVRVLWDIGGSSVARVLWDKDSLVARVLCDDGVA